MYAAFHAANEHKGEPTVLLVKTVKGYGMGKAGEAKNTVHQTKKLADEDIKYIRDRFNIPISDSELESLPYYKPADDTPEMQYLHERRKALGGYLPKRRTHSDESFTVPPLETFKAILEPTAEGREISTTQAYVRFLTQLLRDKALGPRVVPILVDEARTFGMEGLFRQIGIYNPKGQLYTPVDREQVMYYREDKAGQILQEGINEAGGICSWIAAATSYSTNNRIMIPFYVYSSMFGFQRFGDFAWAAGDMQARGYSGRHQWPHHAQRRGPAARGRPQPHLLGHHPQLHQLRPQLCARSGRHHARRPAPHGAEPGKRLLLHHPAQRELRHAGPDCGHGSANPQGHVPVPTRAKSAAKRGLRVQLLGLGLRSCALHDPGGGPEHSGKTGKSAPSLGCPSFTELARDGQEVERCEACCTRWRPPKPPLSPSNWPPMLARLVASTDYVKAFPEQIRPYIPKGRSFKALGTDGFGRSDFPHTSCASTLRSTATTSWSQPSNRWPTKANCPSPKSGRSDCQIRPQNRQDKNPCTLNWRRQSYGTRRN